MTQRVRLFAAGIVLGLSVLATDALAQTSSTELQILNGVNVLRNSAAAQQASLNALQTSVNNLQGSVNGQQTSLASLQASITALQASVTSLQSSLTSLRNAVDRIPSDPRKKFFLSLETADGAHATTRCGAGYHMASLWELFDTSNLKYDRSLGATASDSGQGPPSAGLGWVRTGWRADAAPGFPGSSNCDVWTSADAAEQGTTLELSNQWDEDPVSQMPAINPWRAFGTNCDQRVPVWCVEN